MLAAAAVFAAHACRAVTAWLKERQRQAPPEISESPALVAGMCDHVGRVVKVETASGGKQPTAGQVYSLRFGNKYAWPL